MAFASHARFFLDQGIRLIIPDLPSHGRSSGLHTHVKSTQQLPDAIHLVLREVQQKAQGSRKLFIFGQSMGGYTVVNYASRVQSEVRVDGVIALCPMLQIACVLFYFWRVSSEGIRVVQSRNETSSSC